MVESANPGTSKAIELVIALLSNLYRPIGFSLPINLALVKGLDNESLVAKSSVLVDGLSGLHALSMRS